MAPLVSCRYFPDALPADSGIKTAVTLLSVPLLRSASSLQKVGAMLLSIGNPTNVAKDHSNLYTLISVTDGLVADCQKAVNTLADDNMEKGSIQS